MGNAQSDARISREEESKMMAALNAGSIEDARAQLEANPSLIYVHSKDGLNVWHLAAESGDPQVVEMVSAAVSEVLSHQKKQDKMLAQVNAGFNTVNLAVNHIAAATTAAIPSQIAIPMGRNIDKDAQTRAGKTALMVAVQGGHAEAAAALLACGVDAGSSDIRGNTALHMAAWQGDTACVKLLLEHADSVEPGDLPDARRLVNAANLTGLAPAHFAAWRGHGGVLKELVNAGSLLAAGASSDSMGDVSCNKGSTPLHLAAMKGDVAVIRLLLKAHAKLLELTAGHEARPRDPRRIPDGYGKTAYTIAFDLGRSEAAEVLDPTVALHEAISRAAAALGLAPKKPSPRRHHHGASGGGGGAGAGGLKAKAGAVGGDGRAGAESPDGRRDLIKAGREPEVEPAAVAVAAAGAAPPSAAAAGAAAATVARPPALAPPPRAAAVVPALAPPPKAKPVAPPPAKHQAAAPKCDEAQAQQSEQQQAPDGAGKQQQEQEAAAAAAAGQSEGQQDGAPAVGAAAAQEAASGVGAQESEQAQADGGDGTEGARPSEDAAAVAGAAAAEGAAAAAPEAEAQATPEAEAQATPEAEAEAAGAAQQAEAEAAPQVPAALAAPEPPEDLVCPITGEQPGSRSLYGAPLVGNA
ncbi:MAG: ankyrin repeat-containing domain protein [Monoraphidium minutum]|nr:MAG: ankyrin repeat-containing domain protein [Monoraphidium minutum]